MEKRKLLIGTYDTALTGLWTLRSWELGRAELKEEYADVPGHSGPLDLSTALTDGDPLYGSRPFTATLESSEGSRLEREARINQMINWLDGWRLNIVLPDDPTHYVTGRVKVTRLYNDMAHASVQVDASCDPWKYNASETAVGLIATTTEQTASLINNGRLAVTPTITITGGSINLAFGESSWALGEGVYVLPAIYLKTGTHPLRYSGTGTVLLTYREAVLS